MNATTARRRPGVGADRRAMTARAIDRAFGIRPDRIEAMTSTGLVLSGRVSRWLRLCLHSLLILGIFGMHHVLADQGDNPAAHHAGMEMSVAPSAQPAHDATLGVTWVAATDLGGDGAGTMSDCGGLMILCIAMVMGLSLFLFIRRRVRERVLWRLPRPSMVVRMPSFPPFHLLSPLERSAGLRC